MQNSYDIVVIIVIISALHTKSIACPACCGVTYDSIRYSVFVTDFMDKPLISASRTSDGRARGNVRQTKGERSRCFVPSRPSTFSLLLAAFGARLRLLFARANRLALYLGSQCAVLSLPSHYLFINLRWRMQASSQTGMPK